MQVQKYLCNFRLAMILTWPIADIFTLLLIASLMLQPMMNFQCFDKTASLRSLVSMLAGWFLALIAWRDISHLSTKSLKWWYFMLMCLVLGFILGTLAISNAPLLSSKTLQCTVGLVENMLNPTALSSFTSSIIGMEVQRAMVRLINSLSMELKAISVCSCEAQVIKLLRMDILPY